MSRSFILRPVALVAMALLLGALLPSPGAAPALELLFELEPDFEWLNGIVALIEGTLDAETNTFHYRAWAPSEVLMHRAPSE